LDEDGIENRYPQIIKLRVILIRARFSSISASGTDCPVSQVEISRLPVKFGILIITYRAT